jgi:ERF superfamily
MTQTELITTDDRLDLAPPSVSPIAILEKAIAGGVTTENVSVVKELIQMVREQRAEDAKAAFAKALFQLKKNMPEVYIDKEAKNSKGEVAYRYCSEEEISKAIEPHLMACGFTTLFSEKESDGRVTVELTLIHEEGHETHHEFTVRSGSTNAMKDATAADSGAATTAWRHLVMKMFALKSRLTNNPDAKIVGERITEDQALWLRDAIKQTKSDETAFLAWMGAKTYEDIGVADYERGFKSLNKKLAGL